MYVQRRAQTTSVFDEFSENSMDLTKPTPRSGNRILPAPSDPPTLGFLFITALQKFPQGSHILTSHLSGLSVAGPAFELYINHSCACKTPGEGHVRVWNLYIVICCGAWHPGRFLRPLAASCRYTDIVSLGYLSSPPPRPHISFHSSFLFAQCFSQHISWINILGEGLQQKHLVLQHAKYRCKPLKNFPALWHFLLKSFKVLHKH